MAVDSVNALENRPKMMLEDKDNSLELLEKGSYWRSLIFTNLLKVVNFIHIHCALRHTVNVEEHSKHQYWGI